ncbi:MAG: ubiquinone/menaquinone biosynthesis C-methylase UbiE [Myxococcota bacterium]|jgi:ubiquinone/menaquinone biosynthesis C-methylase UbiE
MCIDCFARAYDPLMSGFEALGLRRWRSELLGPLTGDVLELGAGTGANVPHYGNGVTRLVLVEPGEGMRVALQPRADARGAEVVAGFAEALPFDNDCMDAVVFGLVLCSVRDPMAALAEAKRVLRPSGQLIFMEHVKGRGPLGWLHRAFSPAWAKVAGGCRLDRDTTKTIQAAGFVLEDVKRTWFPGAPLLVPAVRGTARIP